MHRPFLITGAVLGGLAVILGAFGAHSLQQATSDEKIVHGFQTGVHYQMYHALALLAVAIIYERIPIKIIRLAGMFFTIGTILFSGSLYMLTLLKISESNLVKVVGPFTPIGGAFFILGWLFLFLGVLKKK